MTRDDLVVRYRPIRGGWRDTLTDEGDRQSSQPFSAELYKTERLLVQEARHLGATDLFVEIDVPAKDLRSDESGLRGDRKDPDFPGVVVYLVGTRYGDLRYACDRFDQRYLNGMPGWEANLRAIALGLTDLRRVERYGIARRGEQYQGFGELPPGTPLGQRAAPDALDLDGAARLLAAGMDGLDAADLLEDPAAARTAYRVAAKRVHPDNAQTGNPASFRRVNEAWALLESHHGLAS